jgi:hypothetical protein
MGSVAEIVVRHSNVQYWSCAPTRPGVDEGVLMYTRMLVPSMVRKQRSSSALCAFHAGRFKLPVTLLAAVDIAELELISPSAKAASLPPSQKTSDAEA